MIQTLCKYYLSHTSSSVAPIENSNSGRAVNTATPAKTQPNHSVEQQNVSILRREQDIEKQTQQKTHQQQRKRKTTCNRIVKHSTSETICKAAKRKSAEMEIGMLLDK